MAPPPPSCGCCCRLLSGRGIILPWVEESRSQAAKAQVLSSLPVQLYKQQEQEFCQDTHQENEATTAGNTLVKLQAMQ